MKKAITIMALILLAFSSKAQDEFVVRGRLEGPPIGNNEISYNFQRNMFCYLKGDFIMKTYTSFTNFKVDSIISGSLRNFKNETNAPPFYVKLALINESLILDYRQEYTLKIKQFPHSAFYYVDSLFQLPTDEKYLDKLAEFRKNNYQNYQQNIETVTKGSSQERRDFLHKMLKGNDYNFGYADYRDFRYIPYVIPFMTNTDTIIYNQIWHWDGVDSLGRGTGGFWSAEKKELYSDFAYNYLDKTLPFVLPEKTTDSVGWHNWYDSLFSKDCFPFVKYAQSEHKTIASTNDPLTFFLADIGKKKIYFKAARKAYAYDAKTENLTENLLENQLPKRCFYPYNNYYQSIQNNEIAEYTTIDWNKFSKKGIGLYSLTNNAFCCQVEKIIPMEFKNTLYEFIIHNRNDFFALWIDRDEYNCIKAGKINRKGEWIIKEKNLYKRQFEGSLTDISAFSFCQSDKNKTAMSFKDRQRTENGYFDVITVFKINSNLEITDSIAIDFQYTDCWVSRTHLLKKDETYLLLVEAGHNSGHQLYYRLLNDDLTPKTDFVKLSNHRNKVGKPILTSEGFLITWVDNDLLEGLLRSVLIDKLSKQSEIISITNQKIDDIYNVEFDKNNVDIYLFNNDEKTLIKKQINKKEYGL